MADCCTSPRGQVGDAHAMCSRCGAKGVRVGVLTVKALLTVAALRRLSPRPFHLCQEQTCPVVYFSSDGQAYTTADVRARPWQKQPAGNRRICYCFDENEASMRRELTETGRCAAVQRVRDHIAAERCACEVRNPRGTCCLGDLMKAVAQIGADGVSEVETQP
ncbi:putative iron-sulfur cluster-binding metallochaperone [Luteitalea sp.]